MKIKTSEGDVTVRSNSPCYGNRLKYAAEVAARRLYSGNVEADAAENSYSSDGTVYFQVTVSKKVRGQDCSEILGEHWIHCWTED